MWWSVQLVKSATGKWEKKGMLIKCIAAVLANPCSMQHMSGAG